MNYYNEHPRLITMQRGTTAVAFHQMQAGKLSNACIVAVQIFGNIAI